MADHPATISPRSTFANRRPVPSPSAPLPWRAAPIAVPPPSADLRARDLIYEGRLPRPKGRADEIGETVKQTLSRATEFRDDVDRLAAQI